MKTVFPVVWFGFLAVFMLIGVLGGAAASIAFLIVPCAMAVFGFFLMRMLVWDLVDEVWDAGEYLLVKNGDQEERIPIASIINVSASTHQNPPRVTLRLAEQARIGTEVAFIPKSSFSFNPFAKNPVAEDLILRVDRARRQRGT